MSTVPPDEENSGVLVALLFTFQSTALGCFVASFALVLTSAYSSSENLKLWNSIRAIGLICSIFGIARFACLVFLCIRVARIWRGGDVSFYKYVAICFYAIVPVGFPMYMKFPASVYHQ